MDVPPAQCNYFCKILPFVDYEFLIKDNFTFQKLFNQGNFLSTTKFR